MASVVPIAHEATLTQLMRVVERANALLQRQCKKSYVSLFMNQASDTQEFEAGVSYTRPLLNSTSDDETSSEEHRILRKSHHLIMNLSFLSFNFNDLGHNLSFSSE